LGVALDEIDPREPVVRVTLSMEYQSRKATRRNLGEILRCSRGGDSQDIGERRDTPGCGWVAHRGAWTPCKPLRERPVDSRGVRWAFPI